MRSLFRSICLKPRTYPTGSLRNHLRSIATVTVQAAQTEHLLLPELIISPASKHHHSLSTFIEYADRVNLEPQKSIFIGTHYEYSVGIELRRLGFSLTRTGKKSDNGIDLVGYWNLPEFIEPIPIIAQCKAFKQRLTPRHVRELEGAFQGKPVQWRDKSVLGLLVSTQPASRGVLKALKLHDRPLGFLQVNEERIVEQFVWNNAAGAMGLEGVGVTTRHTPKALLHSMKGMDTEQGEAGIAWDVSVTVGRRPMRRKLICAGTNKDIILTWKGTPIFPENIQADEEIKIETESELSKKRGRPRKTPAPAVRIESTPAVLKRRGRPPGSKNKSKGAIDLEADKPKNEVVPKDPKQNRIPSRLP